MAGFNGSLFERHLHLPVNHWELLLCFGFLRAILKS